METGQWQGGRFARAAIRRGKRYRRQSGRLPHEAKPGSRVMTAPPGPGTLRPDRILVRGVNWLGDAVMTTPALQRLREALPVAQITLLTQEKLADLWQRHPSLD